MDTPRSVLEDYCAGGYVQATDLRAAIAWMLAAWDEALAAGADLARADPEDPDREVVLQELLQALLDWDTDTRQAELDITCALALPAFLAQRGEAQVERLPYPRPTTT